MHNMYIKHMIYFKFKSLNLNPHFLYLLTIIMLILEKLYNQLIAIKKTLGHQTISLVYPLQVKNLTLLGDLQKVALIF